jgi:ubiquinone/menaquinone biosynthesis C-methylase UbiE
MTLPVRYPDAMMLVDRERAGYDRIAGPYSTFAFESHQEGRARLLDRLGLEEGQQVLDVCSGPGWVAIDAAARVAPTGLVTGVDISPEMVHVAETNAGNAGVDNAGFLVMDAQSLDLPPEQYDRATCSLGLMHIPDPEQALREIARVLRPGGRLVATVWGPPGETVIDILADSLDAAGQPLSINLRYAVRLGDEGLLADLARDNGFSEVATERIRADVSISDPGVFWDKFQEIGGTFHSLLEELTPEGRAEARQAFIVTAEEIGRDGAIRLPANEVMLVATK